MDADTETEEEEGGGIPLFFLLQCQGRGGWLTKLRGGKRKKEGKKASRGRRKKGRRETRTQFDSTNAEKYVFKTFLMYPLCQNFF